MIPIREYCEQLYTQNFENLEEVVEFLENYKLPKLNQDEIDYLNNHNKETKLIIKKLLSKKSEDPENFIRE